MGRPKNCLQKKINWAIVFHYDDKPDQVKLYTTAKEINKDLNITTDRLYYLTNDQKRHTHHKLRRTRELFKKMTITKIKNAVELQKILSSIY